MLYCTVPGEDEGDRAGVGAGPGLTRRHAVQLLEGAEGAQQQGQARPGQHQTDTQHHGPHGGSGCDEKWSPKIHFDLSTFKAKC